MRLADIVTPFFRTSGDYVQLTYKLLKVTDPSEVEVATSLLKSFYKDRGPGVFVVEPIVMYAAVRAHPRLFETWLEVSSPKLKAVDLVRSMWNLPLSRRIALDKVIAQRLPRNSELARNYQRLQMSVQRNHAKPCGDVSVIIMDEQAQSRTTRYTIEGKVVPVEIRSGVPEYVSEELQRGAISICKYSNGINKMARIGGALSFFVIGQGTRSVLGAAACKWHKKEDTMYIEYLCSARACKGAGTIAMRVIEKYAKLHGIRRIRLISAPDAKQFYKKIGYDTNSQNENIQVKNVFAPATRAKRPLSPNKRTNTSPKRATPGSLRSNLMRSE